MFLCRNNARRTRDLDMIWIRIHTISDNSVKGGMTSPEGLRSSFDDKAGVLYDDHYSGRILSVLYRVEDSLVTILEGV